MKIDAHNHAEWHGHNLDEHLKNMDKYSIDKTWILSWETPANEYETGPNSSIPEFGPYGPIPFSRCLSFAERAPDRFILGYAPDPRRPDAIDRLDAAVRVYGVKVYGEMKLRMMLDNPDAIRMYRFCGEKGLPVVVHIDYEFDTGSKYPRPGYWYGGGIKPFERALIQCPETIFLGHGPGFWAHMADDKQYDKCMYPVGKVKKEGDISIMMRKYANLYCDLSANSGKNALSRDKDYAVKFLKEFQDRILYARDSFDNNLAEFLDSLGLSSEVLDKIYSKNALSLLQR